MKGIYLTEEGKQEIEAKIEHLKILEINSVLENFYQGQIAMSKEILSSAIILPTEEDYAHIQEKYFDQIKNDDSPDTKLIELLQEHFPLGIIIPIKTKNYVHRAQN